MGSQTCGNNGVLWDTNGRSLALEKYSWVKSVWKFIQTTEELKKLAGEELNFVMDLGLEKSSTEISNF